MKINSQKIGYTNNIKRNNNKAKDFEMPEDKVTLGTGSDELNIMKKDIQNLKSIKIADAADKSIKLFLIGAPIGAVTMLAGHPVLGAVIEGISTLPAAFMAPLYLCRAMGLSDGNPEGNL